MLEEDAFLCHFLEIERYFVIFARVPPPRSLPSFPTRPLKLLLLQLSHCSREAAWVFLCIPGLLFWTLLFLSIDVRGLAQSLPRTVSYIVACTDINAACAIQHWKLAESDLLILSTNDQVVLAAPDITQTQLTVLSKLLHFLGLCFYLECSSSLSSSPPILPEILFDSTVLKIMLIERGQSVLLDSRKHAGSRAHDLFA